MNYPYPTPSSYIQAAMSQAVQHLMNGGPLPPNCVVMSIPFQQAQQILPQLIMASTPVNGNDQMMFSQQTPYYNRLPYTNTPQPRALVSRQNYNYPLAPYRNNNNNNRQRSKQKTHQQQYQQKPHLNIYNSSSFDSYMDNLSWSRLFNHSSRKSSRQQNQDQISINYDKKSNSSKKQRSNSSTSSSSTTSDETIRRVDVVNKQTPTINSKVQQKSSLPFKYSSEFIPGVGKQQSQKIKSNDIFLVKKP